MIADSVWGGPTIRRLLESQAALTPTAPALLAPAREPMRYAQLLAQIDQSSRALRAAGIRPSDRVAVVLPNGPEMAAAFLSVSSVAACAPLNPAYRESEFSFYLSDLAPQAVIVDDAADSPVLPAARDLNIPVIPLSALASPATSQLPAPRPDDVALILHTSGTTSRPKQVPLSHSNLCASAQNIRRALELVPADRCLNVMPLFHIHGLAAAVLASLSAGASLVSTPGFYAPQFLDWLSEFEPTWYTAVPTIHQAILARAGDHPRPTSLRFIRSSSAALPPRVAQDLERVFSVPVIEAYGMTEASHQMASNPLPPARRKFGSVGLAAGPEVAILLDGHMAPPGVEGDIVIRGSNVTAGYVANPDANRDAFRDGWFRTGDLGWLDEENYLYISGRTKEIINRAGEKISPREIDEALLEHPAVAQAVAFAVPHPQLGEEPAAAVVFKPGHTAAEPELREFVAHRLADFKVPRRVVALDEIPKGATGKLNRIGLAAQLGLDLPGQPAPAQSQRTPPRTPSEKLVADLWRQVLGCADVGVEDSFFDLGGDSILAAQFLSRLRESTGSAPSLLRLFDHPTVEAVAASLDQTRLDQTRLEQNAGAPASAAPALIRDPAAPAPLSFAQQRFWFLDQYEQDRAAYVQTSALRLRGPLDASRLRDALRQIVQRHEILRTTYDSHDGAPLAILQPAREIELQELSASSLDALHALAASQAHIPFDLTRDLMLRPALVTLGSDDHVLLLTRHHIASDGWSAEILLRELSAFYHGAALPDLPIQYRDYARWQNERFASGVFDDDLAYWKARLAGAPALLDLPLDRPRPPRQTFRGAREFFQLPADLVHAINDLARRDGVTLFMALLAAFQALLHRYSGADELAVGCPVAGRPHIDLEPLIGLFMNTLVLRTDLSGDPSFTALLARVRETSLGALAHQELPFDKLVEVLQPARSLSHSPLFQTLFQLRNLPFAPPRFGDLDCHPLDLDNGVASFELSLEIAPASGALDCSLIYNTALFDPETAAQIARHYRNLLASAVAGPARPLSSLPILDADERRRLLHAWNQTERPFPPDPVHQLFEEQAARTPDAVAVIDRDGPVTYSDLNRSADALASGLRSLGVSPGALVAVSTPRSRAMLSAVLGVLKSGAAYLPLDPQFPPDRLRFMLEDSGAAAVVTDQGIETRTVSPTTALHSIAYAIYTSGSTGTPKAVLVPHSALSNLLQAMRAELSPRERDATVAVTTLSFDIAALEIFLPLITGGSVALAGREQQSDGVALRTLLERVQPAWMQATPATWRMLLDAGWSPGPSFTALCGGETMPRPLAAALYECCSRVFNCYGPTETTIWSTIERVSAAEGAVPIGRPLANTRVYILDAFLEPLPRGVPGDLYIAGAGVAEGYLHRPDLTAERFVPDPFASTPGARMYKTGDLARWLPAGSLDFLGRRDDQVKLRGFRIELGEVEAALAAHPQVQSAAVSLNNDNLTAWCVWRGSSVEPSELRAFLAQRLPAYMLPARFLSLESLPALPNGKVDRRAIASLAPPAPSAHSSPLPDDDAEQRIAAVWEELLDRASIGRFDDVFDLGAHSLLAARAAARIGQTFGIRLPVAAIFEAPTVAALAEYIRRGARAAFPPRVIPIQPRGSRVPFWAIGGASDFRRLAHHLGFDQPVFGLLLEDADAASLGPCPTLETISTEMIRLLRAQQPRGPYQLGGHSLFGLFAWETARQLIALGEEVRLLALFDTYLPKAVRLRLPLVTRARVQFSASWWLLSNGRVADAGAFVADTAKDLASRFLASSPPSAAAPAPLLWDLLTRAGARYEPPACPGRILYLQATDQPIALHLGSRIGWEELALSGLDVRLVPGAHGSLLHDPNVSATAQALAGFLDCEPAYPAALAVTGAV